MVEQGGADEVAAFAGSASSKVSSSVARSRPSTTSFGAGLDALADVVPHPVQRGLGDQRAVVGLGVEAVADAELVDALDEPGAQAVRGLLADRHRDADRHAALACAAVARADQRVDGLVEVGVGHHDHVVLGAAEALRALAVRRGGRVDVLRDVGAADEADGLDVGVAQDGVDGFLVALHDLEHARRAGRPRRTARPGAPGPTGRAQRLEDERVSACQRRAGLPQRDHRREVERGDARDHAERLADRVDVDAACLRPR